MKHIITTVGTSVFSNFLKDKVKRAYKDSKYKSILKKDQLDNFDGISASDYSTDNFRNIEDNLKKSWLIGTNKNNKRWSKWQNDTTIKNTNASAEIKSICKIVEESEGTKFKIYLLCSDTAIGMSAGHLVKAFFEGYKIDGKKIAIEKLQYIKGLQVDSADTFEDEAVLDLIEKVDSIIRDETEKINKENVIFNISGGYKALLPIMTIVGQLESIPLNYIYEDSDQLITIGNMPINFDWDYIYHWELLMRESSLNYISPIYSALVDLDNIDKLTHQHLHIQKEFKELNLNDEQKQRILEIGKQEKKEKYTSIFFIYQKMIREKVLFFEDNQMKPTTIGLLLQKYSKQKQLIDSKRMGPLVELFCYKFFAIDRSKRKTKDLPYDLDLSPTFKPTKFNKEKKDVLSHKEETVISLNEEGGAHDVKDIDISLINKDTSAIVLGECKTVWAYINCSIEDDYLSQIKARVLQQIKINKKQKEDKNIEVLFLVFNFELFSDLNFDTEDTRYEEISNAAIIFQELEKDSQLKNELGSTSFSVKTMVLKRKLTLTKDGKVDWDKFLLHVDVAELNDIDFL